LRFLLVSARTTDPLDLPSLPTRRSSDLVLGFSRAALRATCRAAGIGWAEDPSNANDRFLRVRLRPFEDALAAEGLTPARLSRTIDRKSTRLNSSHVKISYAVFCLKKKKK